MQNAVVVINDRFVLNAERSELLDKNTGEKYRLEPRLMKLLLMLIANQGKVVRREQIIKDIWDDYPGANEGLNQAVSFLRKVLADERKVIIQTQPKIGYIFQGITSQAIKQIPPVKKSYVPALIGAFALVLLLFFAVDIYVRKNILPATGKELYEKNDAEISRGDSIHQVRQMKLFARDTLGPAARGDSLRLK